MSTTPSRVRRRPWRAAVLATLLATVVAGVVQAPAQALTVTVADVGVTPSTADLATGLATLRLDIALQSDVPLEDTLVGQFGNEGITVVAERTDGRDWQEGTQIIPETLWWGDLTRVSGTPTDGVWAASVKVSAHWSGPWRLRSLIATSGIENIDADLTGFGVTLDLGTADLPPWKIAAAPAGPVLVVTGKETWVPRVRVTNRATGAGLAAAMGQDSPYDYYPPPAQLPASALTARADGAGYWSAPRIPLTPPDAPTLIVAYGGRGSRGLSFEAEACVRPLVKWQANEKVAVSGRTVTISGNAWPAPSIYAAANPAIHLQRLVGSTWTTMTSARVRDNGRYTLTWTAPGAGTYQVRAYKPGGQVECSTSLGTVLAAVPVTLR